MRRLGRFLALALVVATIAPVTGCRVEAGQAGGATRILSASVLRSVLLEPQDVGPSFGVDAEHPGFYLSCLSSLWDLPAVGNPRTQVRSRIAAPGRFPWIVQGLAEHRSAGAADRLLDRFAAELDGCNEFRVRNGDELAVGAVRTDGQKASSAVDRQLNVHIVGYTKYTGNPRRYPVGSWFSLIRVGHHVVVTGYTALETVDHGHPQELNSALLDRLLAVADGRNVPPMVPLDIEPTTVMDDGASA